MSRYASKRSMMGLIITEVLICIPIMALLASLGAISVMNYQRARHVSAARQMVAWAASAQLQRIQAGAAIDSLPPAGVIPADVELKTTSTPGQSQWQGFQLVSVSATMRLNAKENVSERISAYVAAEAKP